MPSHNYDSKDSSLMVYDLNTDHSLIGWETRAKPTWLEIILVLYVHSEQDQIEACNWQSHKRQTFRVGETFWVGAQNTPEPRTDEMAQWKQRTKVEI